jgi:hypothetical protein
MLNRRKLIQKKATNTKSSYIKLSLNTAKYLLNTSTSLHTVFAADTLLAKGQVSREEPTLYKGKYVKFRLKHEC